MKSAPTLICKITTSTKVTGNLQSNESINASFSLPTQVEAENFYGSYEYTPSWAKQTIPTANKLLDADIEIDKIQTYETSNQYGTTFII